MEGNHYSLRELIYYFHLFVFFFSVLHAQTKLKAAQPRAPSVARKRARPTLWHCRSLAISCNLRERHQSSIAASIERNWKSTLIHSCFESYVRLQLWNQQSFHEFLANQTYKYKFNYFQRKEITNNVKKKQTTITTTTYNFKFKEFLNFRSLLFKNSISNWNSFSFLKERTRKNQSIHVKIKRIILNILTDRLRCSSNNCTISVRVLALTRALLTSTLNSSRARTESTELLPIPLPNKVSPRSPIAFASTSSSAHSNLHVYARFQYDALCNGVALFFFFFFANDFHQTKWNSIVYNIYISLTRIGLARCSLRPKQSASATHRCLHLWKQHEWVVV